RLAVDDVLANGAVFDLAERILHFTRGRLTFFLGEAGNHLLAQLAQACIAVLLDGDGVGLGNRLAKLAANSVEQLGVFRRRLPVPSRLAGFGGQLGNGLDNHLEFVVGEQHRAQHLVFGELLGFGLHHQDGVLGAGHDHVQAGSLELLVGRVQQVAGFRMESHARGANGAVERNTGDGQRSGGTDHRCNVRIGLLAGRYHGADHLHFILETFREQRADRTVDQARGQGFLFGRARFTLEEATRNLTGSVGLFLVMHRQREKALARVGGLGANDGDQHAHVVVNGDQDGAGGLTGNTASLEGYGRLTELKFLDYRVHGVFLLSVAFGGNWREWRESDPVSPAEAKKLEARSRKRRIVPSFNFKLPAPGFQLATS